MNNYNLVFLRIFVSSCQLFKTTFVRSLELHVFITVEDGDFLLLLFIMIICNVSLHMTILWKKAPAEEEEELESCSQGFGWSPKWWLVWGMFPPNGCSSQTDCSRKCRPITI